jgi:5S rRNA maturation endonuclease (ribonuclease M5)
MNKTLQIKLFEELFYLLKEIEEIVNIVVVEGQRDVKALRSLGFKGNIVSYSQLGVSDSDLVSDIGSRCSNVLLLTDFDDEGLIINNKLKRLLELSGVKVEIGLRREFGRFMARLGVYAVESLDNIFTRLCT